MHRSPGHRCARTNPDSLTLRYFTPVVVRVNRASAPILDNLGQVGGQRFNDARQVRVSALAWPACRVAVAEQEFQLPLQHAP